MSGLAGIEQEQTALRVEILHCQENINGIRFIVEQCRDRDAPTALALETIMMQALDEEQHRLDECWRRYDNLVGTWVLSKEVGAASELKALVTHLAAAGACEPSGRKCASHNYNYLNDECTMCEVGEAIERAKSLGLAE